ncbi:MAG: hypothetical protein B6241_09535 [Spirochaetaceae bacterium 4572_59]|nr:MAG: hypothetical protein B6241_09535 [Spirochaetaceae bacterium 4572_59]
MPNFYHLKDLSSNFEDYLKTIGDLEAEKQQIRSKEIARIMKVKPSSVTNALQVLREQDLITYRPYGPIALTHKGKQIWLILHQKYKAVKEFLSDTLEIDHHMAEVLAHKIEHAVSSEVSERMFLLNEFLNTHSSCGAGIREKLHDYYMKETKESEKTIDREPTPFLLSFLKAGEKGTIHKLKGDAATREKLMNMGMNRGQDVLVERIAPLGDPMEISVRGYSLSLRKSEAGLVIMK